MTSHSPAPDTPPIATPPFSRSPRPAMYAPAVRGRPRSTPRCWPARRRSAPSSLSTKSVSFLCGEEQQRRERGPAAGPAPRLVLGDRRAALPARPRAPDLPAQRRELCVREQNRRCEECPDRAALRAGAGSLDAADQRAGLGAPGPGLFPARAPRRRLPQRASAAVPRGPKPRCSTTRQRCRCLSAACAGGWCRSNLVTARARG